MSSLKPGEFVQVTNERGARPYLLVREESNGSFLLRTLAGAAVGDEYLERRDNIYPWPQGEDLEALQRGKVAAANQIVTETKVAITEAATEYVKEDPDGAPFIARMLAEAGCPPMETRYTATLTVNVTIEFGTNFDETTAKLVENSLHISDDEDCIHITHDADLIDMKLAHSVTGLRVQKLEAN